MCAEEATLTMHAPAPPAAKFGSKAKVSANGAHVLTAIVAPFEARITPALFTSKCSARLRSRLVPSSFDS
jgi:hypothetical protein